MVPRKPSPQVISADELRRRAPEYISAYATIVTFCTIGGRSGTFCKRLVDDLLEFGQVSADQTDGLRRKIVNILGGMAAWLHVHGGLVDTMGQPTNQLHPWCRAFLDMFPLEDLDLVFDEFRPVPQDAPHEPPSAVGGREPPPNQKHCASCAAVGRLDDPFSAGCSP